MRTRRNMTRVLSIAIAFGLACRGRARRRQGHAGKGTGPGGAGGSSARTGCAPHVARSRPRLPGRTPAHQGLASRHGSSPGFASEVARGTCASGSRRHGTDSGALHVSRRPERGRRQGARDAHRIRADAANRAAVGAAVNGASSSMSHAGGDGHDAAGTMRTMGMDPEHTDEPHHGGMMPDSGSGSGGTMPGHH